MSRDNLKNGEFSVDQLDKIRIEDCTRLFKFLCPKKWKSLQPTEQEYIRFCNISKKKVTLYTTDEALKMGSGHCIALINPEDRDKDDTVNMMGEFYDPHDEYYPLQLTNEQYARKQHIENLMRRELENQMGGTQERD